MLNKRRPSSGWLSIMLLVFAILLSIYLILQLLLAPGQRTQDRQNDTPGTTQTLNRVFRPVQEIVNDAKGKTVLWQTASLKRVETIRETLVDADFRYQKEADVTQKELQTVLTRTNSLVLRYANPLPLSYFNARYEQDVDHPDKRFDYIVIPYQQLVNNRIYLVDTQEQSVVTLSASGFQQAQIADEVTNYQGETIAVRFDTVNRQMRLIYEDDIQLPNYSYLTTMQEPHRYATQLLGGSGVTTQVLDGGGMRYENAATRQTVTLDEVQQNMTFVDQREQSNPPNTFSERLARSFAQINLPAANLSDIRYFEKMHNGREIVYRTYVDDWPVFYQADNGAILTTIDDKGRITTDYSLVNLNVPVPNDNQPVTLPSMDKILKQLAELDIPQDAYVDLTPGYQWTYQKQGNRVVDLTPTWMIKTSDEAGWERLSDFIASYGPQARKE